MYAKMSSLVLTDIVNNQKKSFCKLTAAVQYMVKLMVKMTERKHELKYKVS